MIVDDSRDEYDWPQTRQRPPDAGAPMRHFSCDLCGKTLTPGDDARYVVRIEGYAILDEEETVLDESEADSVDSMDELLTEQVAFEALEDESVSDDMVPASAKKEYDLCRGCYARMLRDPLGTTMRHSPGFSRN